MKVRICWTKDDHEDSMVIEADTLERLQEIATEEMTKRQPDDYWSEDCGE
jgi:hypothetical protein